MSAGYKDPSLLVNKLSIILCGINKTNCDVMNLAVLGENTFKNFSK